VVCGSVVQDPVAFLGEGGFMVSDGGISEKHLLGPYSQPTTGPQQNFNFCHSSTRFVVEQVFGMWKQTWRILITPLDMSWEHANDLIFATAVLHNMAVMWRGAGGVRSMAHVPRGVDTRAIEL
jgi:hypothetical protein